MNLSSPATTMTDTICPGCEQRQMSHSYFSPFTLWHCNACGEEFMVCDDGTDLETEVFDSLSKLDELQEQAAEVGALKDVLDKTEADLRKLILDIKVGAIDPSDILEDLNIIYRSI